MSSSSRSLAAARARRSGENAPPVSGNRPVTSIGSYAQQMPPLHSNVRVARSGQPYAQPPQPYKAAQYAQKPPQNQNAYYDPSHPPQPPSSHPPSNGLPFSKLSISDAIGLITLRLGRVEQWIIDTDNEHETREKGATIPENHSIIDSSVLTTIVNRIDVLEKNTKNTTETQTYAEEIAKLSQDVKQLVEQVTRITNDANKHTIENAKQNEQFLKLTRDVTETKDILKSFMMKYDLFAQEITQNFVDYEAALGEIEKRIPTYPEEAVPPPEVTEPIEPIEPNADATVVATEEITE